jgi:uncharacterized protein (DUF697 family)
VPALEEEIKMEKKDYKSSQNPEAKNCRTDKPKDKMHKCHSIIHIASLLAGGIGASPIPFSDALPLCGLQISMIISLGKVFGLTVGKAVAEEIAAVVLAGSYGPSVASNLMKVIPVAGPAVGAFTAVTITEGMGWMVADDFYKISIGEKPERILKAMVDVAALFGKVSKAKGKK